MEIHPCDLQDIGPLGPLPCSHSPSSANHSKQGIGYCWPCAILGWLVIYGAFGHAAPALMLPWPQIWPLTTLYQALLIVDWLCYKRLCPSISLSVSLCAPTRLWQALAVYLALFYLFLVKTNHFLNNKNGRFKNNLFLHLPHDSQKKTYFWIANFAYESQQNLIKS